MALVEIENYSITYDGVRETYRRYVSMTDQMDGEKSLWYIYRPFEGDDVYAIRNVGQYDHVWDVRTDPSSEAFLPTVMVVHSSLNVMSVCAGRVPKAKMYAAPSSSSRMLFIFQFRFFPVLVYEVFLSVLNHACQVGLLRVEKADFVVHRLDHLNALGVDEAVFPIFGH